MKEEYKPNTIEQKLGYLVEECGEVLHAVGKTQRWGLESVDPTDNAKLITTNGDGYYYEYRKETNREWILREIKDLEQAINMVKEGLSQEPPIIKAIKYGTPCTIPIPSFNFSNLSKIEFPKMEEFPQGVPLTFDRVIEVDGVVLDLPKRNPCGEEVLQGDTTEHFFIPEKPAENLIIDVPISLDDPRLNLGADFIDFPDPIYGFYHPTKGYIEYTGKTKSPAKVQNFGQFRVFSEGKMHYEGFYIDQVTGKCFYESNEDGLMDCGEEEPILMPYIGIKTFGINIYVGDIIEYDETDIGGKKGVGEVIWCDDMTLMHTPGFTLINRSGIFSQFPMGWIKVLGNIYENPEIANDI